MLNSSAQPNFEVKRDSSEQLRKVLVPILLLTGAVLRYAGLAFITVDMYNGYLDWYDELAVHGFAALREPFAIYTPPYLYLMFFMTKTVGFIPKVVAIKLIPICFDLLNAVLVYKILKIRYPEGVTALIGATSFLLLPTVLLNSAYWGQIDSTYTFFVLFCIYFLMKRQPLWGMIVLGLAFSFKAQAIFLAPFLLLLIVRKQISWFYLGIIPIVYALMMIPAALTGRPFIELLTIYARQADTFQRLSAHAPNVYLFIPDTFYTYGLVIGLAVTAFIVLIWTAIYASKIREFSPQIMLLCALASAAFMPFFLPKMHDRYFYLAEVLSFLVAFYFPRLWLIALGYQLVSGLVYSVVLLTSVMLIDPALTGSIMILAAFLNIALMGYVFLTQWKLMNNES